MLIKLSCRSPPTMLTIKPRMVIQFWECKPIIFLSTYCLGIRFWSQAKSNQIPLSCRCLIHMSNCIGHIDLRRDLDRRPFHMRAMIKWWVAHIKVEACITNLFLRMVNISYCFWHLFSYKPIIVVQSNISWREGIVVYECTSHSFSINTWPLIALLPIYPK